MYIRSVALVLLLPSYNVHHDLHRRSLTKTKIRKKPREMCIQCSVHPPNIRNIGCPPLSPRNMPSYRKLPSATLAVESLQKRFQGLRGHCGLGMNAAAASRRVEPVAESGKAGAGAGAAQPGSVFAPLDFCVEDGGVERKLAAELRRQEELNKVGVLT